MPPKYKIPIRRSMGFRWEWTPFRRRLAWAVAGIVLLGLLHWWFGNEAEGSPRPRRSAPVPSNPYRLTKRSASAAAPTPRRAKPPTVDAWTQWSQRMRNPLELERAIEEAPQWVRTHREETLLVLLHLASHGSGTIWRPDPVMARVLLQQLREDTPDMLLPTLEVAMEDQLGAPIPWPSELFEAAAASNVAVVPPHDPGPVGMDATFALDAPLAVDRNLLATAAERRLSHAPPAVRAPAFTILMDMAGSQNVHDHVAQQMASKGAAALPELSPLEAPDRGRRELRRRLETRQIPELTAQERADALRVLDHLDGRLPHSRFGFTEEEALERVWKRIEDPVNQDRRENLIYTLAKSLASGIEHDAVVCSTGRMMRVLGALDGADAENIMTIRSDQQVNEELRQFVAHQRDTLLETWSEEERAKYHEDDEAVMTKLREHVRKAAHREYVDRGVMQAPVLEPKLDDLLQYV